jgi:hypothetical protein
MAKPHVEVECIGCGKKKKIYAGDVEPGDHPMCDCGMPFVPTKASSK